MEAVGVTVSPELVDDEGNRPIPSVDLVHPIDRNVDRQAGSYHLANLIPEDFPTRVFVLPSASLLRCKLACRLVSV